MFYPIKKLFYMYDKHIYIIYLIQFLSMVDNKNPWSCSDEKEHEKSAIEWWCFEAFLKQNDNKKKWNLKASFGEWFKKSKEYGSNFFITLFDLDENKHYSYYSENQRKKLKIYADHKTQKINYKDSYIEGLFPDYKIFLNDKKNNIQTNLTYKSEALPHWVSQGTTNGWLPMGLGFYRYGFIPKCKISGLLNINQNNFSVNGSGYYEHVWGDFSYTNWFTYSRNIKKSLSTYAKLMGKWLQCKKPRIPNSLAFSKDNNPLGYDWAWAVFDNGWTLFYGNILGWILKGPVIGTIILSKDGCKYKEFFNGCFEYKKIEYSEDHDIYYPTEISLIFQDDKEKFKINFKKKTDPYGFLFKLSDNKNAYIVYEQPGTVKGFYSNGDRRIDLEGFCKFEPQRQLFNTNHSSISLDFLKPPEGFGLNLVLNSHGLNKKIKTKFQLYPKIKIDFKSVEINKSDYFISDFDKLF